MFVNILSLEHELWKNEFFSGKKWKETHILQGIPFPLIYKLETKSFWTQADR